MTSEQEQRHNQVGKYIRDTLGEALLLHLLNSDKVCVKQYAVLDQSEVLFAIYFEREVVGALRMVIAEGTIEPIRPQLAPEMIKSLLGDGAMCTELTREVAH